MSTLCRDCGGLCDVGARRAAVAPGAGRRGSSHHEALGTLSIAHVDCDAFYATVEKRERPELADRPVIVGGGARGVVLACCYVARLYGVRSAMPMFKALAACPDAVVIRPDMAKYREVGRAVRAEMRRLTPLVEPVSIDEAFLDLVGHREAARRGAGRSCSRPSPGGSRRRSAITLSIGLSDSKFLAKIASDLDKPRGFAVLGRGEAPAFFADKPVSLLWGVGAALQRRLAADGITLIGQLAALGERELAARYGRIGPRLAQLARGRLTSSRTRSPAGALDLGGNHPGAGRSRCGRPWHTSFGRYASGSSAHLKEASLAAGTVTLKLKTGDFRLRTRSRRLADPTQLAETLFRTASALLAAEADGVTRYRLIGVGADLLVDGGEADLPTLFDDELGRPRRLEQAIDEIRGRLGDNSLRRGRDLARLGVRSAAEVAPHAVAAGAGVAPERPGGDQQSRLAQRLDVVELGADRIVAVIDHHVARDAVVEEAHAELVIRLLGMRHRPERRRAEYTSRAAPAAG